MPKTLNPTLKVGLFVLLAIVVLTLITLKVSKTSLTPGGTYKIYLMVEAADGITKKTPVQIAGIQVGYVSDIELVENNRARLTLSLGKKVKISQDVEARIKSVGFLGDTYIELYQKGPIVSTLPEKSVVTNVHSYGDFSSLTGQLSSVAEDVKAITTTMRGLMAGDDSSFATSIKNIEKLTTALARVAVQNEQNLNIMLANFRALSQDLAGMVDRNSPRVDATMDNIDVITSKIRNGEGTVGKLINDETTVNKINDSLDSLNGVLGGVNRLRVDLGFHTEYLGNRGDMKHYVGLALRPRPDKAFLFDFVSDPSPAPNRQKRDTTITSGGVTSTVHEEIKTADIDQFRISAQLAKQFYGLTVRGGIIESRGGVGLDYQEGPLGLSLSAFDFGNKDNGTHLKATGTFNVTRSLYLMGGADNIISKTQDPDLVVGAGFQFTDDDIKSLLGMINLNKF